MQTFLHSSMRIENDDKLLLFWWTGFEADITQVSCLASVLARHVVFPNNVLLASHGVQARRLNGQKMWPLFQLAEVLQEQNAHHFYPPNCKGCFPITKINRREFLDRSKQAGVGLAGLTLLGNEQSALGATGKVFRAGAHAMDITPTWFPVVVNGGFQPRYAKKAEDQLHARCLVLDELGDKPRKTMTHIYAGDDLKTALVGRTTINLRTWERGKCWHQVVLVRDGELVAVYLDGNPTPEITGSLKPTAGSTFFLGGRNDGFSNFEGKLDEVSVYNRPLTSGEVVAHWHAAKP